MKGTIYLILFLLCVSFASAAILHGTIYDSNFNKLNDVIVEVNTTPPQVFVSKEGQYSFVLDTGNYAVVAKYRIGGDNYLYTSENVTIARNGYFLVDLFLNPAKKIDMPVNPLFNYTLLISVISVLLLIFLGVTIYKLRSRPKIPSDVEVDKYTQELLAIIGKEGGRVTQKDIRKKIPLSEAKVSLMISELEEKGILKRIKKGRGNIIVLNKK